MSSLSRLLEIAWTMLPVGLYVFDMGCAGQQGTTPAPQRVQGSSSTTNDQATTQDEIANGLPNGRFSRPCGEDQFLQSAFGETLTHWQPVLEISDFGVAQVVLWGSGPDCTAGDVRVSFAASSTSSAAKSTVAPFDLDVRVRANLEVTPLSAGGLAALEAKALCLTHFELGKKAAIEENCPASKLKEGVSLYAIYAREGASFRMGASFAEIPVERSKTLAAGPFEVEPQVKTGIYTSVCAADAGLSALVADAALAWQTTISITTGKEHGYLLLAHGFADAECQTPMLDLQLTGDYIESGLERLELSTTSVSLKALSEAGAAAATAKRLCDEPIEVGASNSLRMLNCPDSFFQADKTYFGRIKPTPTGILLSPTLARTPQEAVPASVAYESK